MNQRFYLALSLLTVSAATAHGAYPDLILADNPVAYYRFEELAGTTAADSSGSGNDGVYMNGVQLAQPGIPAAGGRSARFDGSDDYVSTPQIAAADFTLEAWIRTTADSPTGSNAYEGDGLLWSDVGGSGNDFVVGILNNQLSVNTGNPDVTVTGGPLLNDGIWHHVAVTRKQGVGVELFVDGVSVATGSTNGAALTDNPNIMIGGNTLDGRYFDGWIDEVAYYETALTASQIQSHANAVMANVPAVNGWGKMLMALALAAVASIAIRGSAG